MVPDGPTLPIVSKVLTSSNSTYKGNNPSYSFIRPFIGAPFHSIYTW